jgi:two-component system cell cycle sensor histidine kinase/response regulator CckA
MKSRQIGDLIDLDLSNPPPTVLVIEDEGYMRHMISQKLSRGGFLVIEAASGAETLQKLDGYTGALDLVLSDIVMRGMSGKDVIAQIRITRPGVRVLYMSGYPADFIASRGVLEEGALFVEKTDLIGDGLLQKVRAMIQP